MWCAKKGQSIDGGHSQTFASRLYCSERRRKKSKAYNKLNASTSRKAESLFMCSHTHTFSLYPTGPFTCSLFFSFCSSHAAIPLVLASKPISSCGSLSHVHEISTLVYPKLLLYVWYISAFCDHFFRNAHWFCVLCVDLIGIHINVCT